MNSMSLIHRRKSE